MEKMKLLDISTNVLAIKIVDNFIFTGIGCVLHIFKRDTFEFSSKLSILHPHNIHGIISKEDNKLIIYGNLSLVVLKLEISHDNVRLEKLTNVVKFDDWIIDAQWLGPVEDPTLSILLAHNSMVKYKFDEGKISRFQCSETCMLYAGLVTGENCENAVALAGTVFREILVWKISSPDVLHRLRGHNGVIFSVFYSPELRLLASTSDDRSVRLWKIQSLDEGNHLDWTRVKITLDKTMYGHLARVWKVVLLRDDVLASIGEDSKICFWTTEGQLIKTVETHCGTSIWCIEASQDSDIVYTGGGDGSINLTPFPNVANAYLTSILLDDETDFVHRWISFADCDCSRLILLSNRGKECVLHNVEIATENMQLVDLPKYPSSYFVIEPSRDKQFMAIGSITGEVTIYKHNNWTEYQSDKFMDSKIFSMKWLDEGRLLICGADGRILILRVSDCKGVRKETELQLPSSRERWVTAACTHENLLICGDRMGSIFVYDLDGPPGNINPLQAFKRIHGKLGVQSCKILDSKLLTTGRDGTVRFYNLSLSDRTAPVEFLHAKKTPMDWVNRVLKFKNHYIVLGFKEENFIIYNLNSEQIIRRIVCGGGHRSWDCVLRENKIKLVYIQKKKIYLAEIPFNPMFCSPLHAGYHLKNENCAKILPAPLDMGSVVISGGEDCRLRLDYIDPMLSDSGINVENLHSFGGHLSSIKCLDIVMLNSGNQDNSPLQKYMVFSGGGRAQMRVWELSVRTDRKKDVIFKDLTSYMLYGSDDKRAKVWVGNEIMYSNEPETRFMDMSALISPNDPNVILVFLACSDANIRTLLYNIEKNCLKLVGTQEYDRRCILKVHLLTSSDDLLLMSMATDGLLNFWLVNTSAEEQVNLTKVPVDDGTNYSLHQSGVNSFDVKPMGEGEYLLGTGGDDGLLSLLRFKIVGTQIKTVWAWKSHSSHTGQITGLKFLNDKLISVSADQRLVVHENLMDPVFLTAKCVCIPDVQGIETFRNQRIGVDLLYVYGKGFQLLQDDTISIANAEKFTTL